MWQFWIDRGGTFTDIVARKPDGTLESYKLLSDDPERYKDAAVHGVRKILGLAPNDPIPEGAIEAIKMGSTVATNALLERKGDRTVLFITRGLRDLLRIGYQNRPKLFDLNIELPELLHEDVVEVAERVDSQGRVVAPLHPRQVRAALSRAHDQGFRSIAVALMHGYRFQEHEKMIGKMARQQGFTQVSLSHEVSPLVKLVSRGDTTVVDAYLSPILKRYIVQVGDALGADCGSRTSLVFMQSNGGLTDAMRFQGKDAILSGPAGGVVGMVRTAQDAGFEKLIGFDMGGTSTDVCHHAGEYERSFETEVAGVRMRAPMMSIHTVAAGGGGILSFRQGRLQVGPESAGANPGPASYRRGGPLAVTDCNVVLGKIQPDRFPAVFGPDGNDPLDVRAARAGFEVLADEIARETGDPRMGVEALAEGFLRIAVENMANAIKKISVQRGYDVTQYTLNCFGGAGGQHACQVADVLGMESIFIHPFAGVLSAFGMGLADIRVIRENQFSASISCTESAWQVLQEIGNEARNEVLGQGVGDDRIEVVCTAHVRTPGSHHAIPVRFGEEAAMRAEFDMAHRQRFGFVPEHDDLIVDLLTAEAIGSTGECVTLTPQDRPGTGDRTARMFSEAEWRDVPLVTRDRIRAHDKVAGPAIIVEPTGTNVVEPGWQAEGLAGGGLVLRRIEPTPRREAIGTGADPIMLEVFNNLFMSVADQMGATLANTASSVNIKERLDFSCAIFAANGDLVANAPHVPVHLGSMSESVRTILRKNEGRIRPGDVFMMNNPYDGGTHLPDVTVITPVFDEAGEEIIFIAASRGHHADIGGKTPGSAPPDSRHIDEEGVLIDNFLLVARGRLKDGDARALLASGKFPCRNVDQNMADLAAQVAANATGAQELSRIVGQFGLDVVQAYMGHVQANAEECVRRVLDVLKDCRFTYPLDNGARIKVQVSVDRDARSAVIDFTGTSPQDAINYNAPLSICRAVVLYVFRTLVGADIPMNEGCLKPIRIVVPKGTMINPEHPAAVISGNTEVSQAIADTLFGALGVVAGSQGTMNNFVYGNDRYQNYETICGGTGAGDGFDGASAVHSHMTNTRMTDPEVLEDRFPVRVEEFSIRTGSGGAGEFRGGDGVVRRLRFLEPMTVTVLSSHRQTVPFGASGGQPGLPGEDYVLRSDGSVENLAGNDETRMQANDVFVMRTPGGGGFGAEVKSSTAGSRG
ncbi:MAG: 5-oxoprolinase [Boseongicola sp. SB0676_bin_33]|nr:5-oxoprolinase [Boseongicola sp. SB0676_bin_33]